MALNNNNPEGYSHAEYRIPMMHHCGRVQGPVSTTDFAHFRSRNKVIVRAVHIQMRSAASATLSAGSCCVTRRVGASASSHTINTGSVWAASAAMTSTVLSITLTADNTLVSVKDYMALRLIGLDVGEYNVMWEYDVVYPAGKTGS